MQIREALFGMRLSHFIAGTIGIAVFAWLRWTDPRPVEAMSLVPALIWGPIFFGLLWECCIRIFLAGQKLLTGHRAHRP